MSIKTILVPILEDASRRSGILSAFLVGRAFGGHVEGLHVPRRREKVTAEAVMSSQECLRMMDQDTRRRLEDARRERLRENLATERIFCEVASAMGIGTLDTPSFSSELTASFKVVFYTETEVLASHGRIFDLIVVDQPTNDPRHEIRKVLRAFLFHSGRPILVAPQRPPRSVCRNVLIAWNGSALSARAASVSRQYFLHARRVGVVSVATGQRHQPSAHDLSHYLAWHGIDAGVREVSLGRRRLGEVLLEEAADFGADLLVMGAYAQSPFRESLTRGVTNYILSHADVPVLMVH